MRSRRVMLALAMCVSLPNDNRDDNRVLTPRLVSVASAETLAVFSSGPPSDRRTTNATPTVIILPGPIGSAFSMRHITSALNAQGISTVVIDLLGMGVSARPPRADYSLTKQARRVSVVLDSLRLSRVLVVAHGTSATVAYHLAADEPDRVTSIVSLAGGAIDKQGTHGVKLALAFAPLLDTPLGRTLGRRKFLASVREQSASADWCTDAVLREYLAPYERDLRGSLRALGRMSEAVEPQPIAGRLPHVTAPVRLLLGAKYSANAPTTAEVDQLRRLLPRLAVDTIAGTGTMLHEERADAVVNAVRAQLDQATHEVNSARHPNG